MVRDRIQGWIILQGSDRIRSGLFPGEEKIRLDRERTTGGLQSQRVALTAQGPGSTQLTIPQIPKSRETGEAGRDRFL